MSKHSAAYWQSRVFRPTYTRDGEVHTVGHFSVKIQHAGKRKTLTLGTNDKGNAASKARVLYEQIISRGWESLEAKEATDITVGEYISQALAVMDVSDRTRRNYATALRTVVSQALNIGVEDREKYRPGSTTWRDKVDSIHLSQLTSERIQKWKLRYGKANSPDEQRRKRTSANSYLRNASSLFAPKVSKHLTSQVENPFAGIDFFPRQSHRYVSQIDAESLLDAAMKELEQEPLKVFLLALMCGLRASEVDQLTWELIDLEGGKLHMRNTRYLKLKSETSAGVIPLDSEFLALLRGWKSKAVGAFVVETSGRPGKKRDYRCQRHFRTLYDWLRKNGVTAPKPLHSLRKEYGSIICQRHGIYAASRLLRHADIAITTAHYTSAPEGALTTGLKLKSS